MKTLPKYFAIQNDGSERFKRYIEWLEEITGEHWIGTSVNSFYGFDGGDAFRGTDVFDDPKYFANPVTILTLDEWEEIIKSKFLSRSTVKRFLLIRSRKKRGITDHKYCSCYRLLSSKYRSSLFCNSRLFTISNIGFTKKYR